MSEEECKEGCKCKEESEEAKEEKEKIELEEEKYTKSIGALDKIISKVISRRLLVFLIATVLLFVKDLPFDDWVTIVIIYLGSLGLTDMIVKWKVAGKQ